MEPPSPEKEKDVKEQLNRVPKIQQENIQENDGEKADPEEPRIAAKPFENAPAKEIKPLQQPDAGSQENMGNLLPNAQDIKHERDTSLVSEGDSYMQMLNRDDSIASIRSPARSPAKPRALQQTLAPSVALRSQPYETRPKHSQLYAHQQQHHHQSSEQPKGMLFMQINGIFLRNTADLPSNTLVTMYIDNGVHSISSRLLQLHDLAEFSEGYRVGIIPGSRTTIVLKLERPHLVGTKQDLGKIFDLGSDGSYAQFDLAPFQKTAFGKIHQVTIDGRNAWSARRPTVATMNVDALYVPSVSRKEKLPETIEDALAKIRHARQAMANKRPRMAGSLRQFGGDVSQSRGKVRHCVLDPVSPLLVIHSSRNRHPRALINLAKATHVARLGDNAFELQFRNKDSLAFHAPDAETLDQWVSQLNGAVGTRGARPKWIDAVLYESF